MTEAAYHACATRPLPPPSAPPFVRENDALVAGRATYAGRPDELVDALLDIRRRAGVPVELVARSHFPLLEHAAQLDLMKLLQAQMHRDAAPGTRGDQGRPAVSVPWMTG